MRFLLLAVAACTPMYAAPPDPLHPVKRLPVPKEPVAEVHYVDACETDFHLSAQKAHPQPKVAEPLIAKADADVAKPEPEHLVTGIQHYVDALRADPYNAHVTLALAVAYDRALHRGCALAMLHRLEALSENPKIAPEAGDRIADVVDNPQWFKGYRKDALAAVNR